MQVLAVIVIICSVFGLPWFVAATVLSINHIQSLTKESESSAPGEKDKLIIEYYEADAHFSLLFEGEKPQFLGIREQRVTAVLIAICIGLSIFITPILRLIPMPVLYGVFLFMGVSSLKGLQFFDRCLRRPRAYVYKSLSLFLPINPYLLPPQAAPLVHPEEVPAGLRLPEVRSPVPGAPVHLLPADGSHPPLGHQE